MDYNKLTSFIKNEIMKTSSNSRKFMVRKGKGWKTVKFFLSGDGSVCFTDNTRSNSGYYLHWYYAEEVKEIKVKKPVQITARLVRKRAKECVDMLSKSGLWQDLMESMKEFLRFSDSEIDRFIKDGKENWYELVWTDKEGRYACMMNFKEVFYNLICEKCWESIPFAPYSRSRLTMELGEAIREKRDYCHTWRNGYDCRVSTSFVTENGVTYARGWMAKEFLGCANGHYYILLDERHAAFMEDD